ncbi:UNKNOWN [Stylonychia lemnae]|uniref:Transcription initiation factor IIF subunit beta n=1 Tax=Stylonychia lemnae TaxID=5949 RepID=A0A078AG62_STYLE|nr:UNKNOWN [Stylonychia lemnae]|eukprot:CDW80467.1 UNKNOWN [Stylonychia lemnae]
MQSKSAIDIMNLKNGEAFIIKLPNQVYQDLQAILEPDDYFQDDCYIEVGEFVYDFKDQKASLEFLSENSQPHILDIMNVDSLKCESRSQFKVLMSENSTTSNIQGSFTNLLGKRQKLLNSIDHEVLTMPRNYQVKRQKINANQNQLVSVRDTCIITDKVLKLNLGSQIFDLKENKDSNIQNVKKNPMKIAKVNRKSLTSDQIRELLIRLFNSQKVMNYQEIQSIMKNPDGPLRLILGEICEFDKKTKTYSLKSFLQI